jgi:hypothetical protein
MTDAPLKKCPKCAGEIHRLISAAGIVFKGSGFHVTDYGDQRLKTIDRRPQNTEHRPQEQRRRRKIQLQRQKVRLQVKNNM